MSTQEENAAPGKSNSREEEKTPCAKRKADDLESSSTEESKRPCTNDDEGEVLDLAKTLGFKAGDRLEVQWEVHSDGNQSEEPTTRWWGATLLEHDGRTEDSVAVRVLDYDPYPEGGFPERSKEDVIFMGKDTLVNPETHDELNYRPVGGAAVLVGKEDIENVLNATLENALKKNSAAWKSMSSAQQAVIASAVADKKQKLLDLLSSQTGVVTSSDMKSILSKTMEG